MTHPPYGDDERDGERGGHAQPAPPWGGQQPARSQGTPSTGQFGHGQPPFGPPRPGPPPYGYPASGQSPYGQSPYGQSAYGPPPYGQPASGPPPYGQPGWEQLPPPGRSRRPLLLLLGLLAVVVAVGAVLLLTALQSTALDPTAVQRDVAEQFEQREGVAVELQCGDDMTVEAGRDYRCSGTTADGEPVTITITVTDEQANYTWGEG
ncbi:DUF4333 domain-containing protein [Modestobacter lapidis]|nr:DUF4333 domain-containing protein [Modestobacter lapidis]